jgi:hypothetical protein
MVVIGYFIDTKNTFAHMGIELYETYQHPVTINSQYSPVYLQ